MLPRPTAIFACNDLMALGVLHAVHELGLRCPEELSLVGFDNLEFCQYTSPALSSVFQPDYQLGATAAGLLLERINGLRNKPKRIVLETELKIRNSVMSMPRAATLRNRNPRSQPTRARAEATERR
jgi:LacI family transcriptional regulator